MQVPEVAQESCQTCIDVVAGKIAGACMMHGVVRLEQEKMRMLIDGVEKESQRVVKKYMMQSLEQKVTTTPEEISEKTFMRIQSMKEQLHVRTFDGVVDILTKEMAFRYDPMKSLETNTPMLVIGPPQSGKTMFTKEFIKNYPKVCVIEVAKEYSDLEIVSVGDLLGNVWQTKEKFRVIPSANPLYSELEMNMTFGILHAKMQEENSPLRDFCFVIEDAIRYATILSVRSFIGESRKWIKKCIVVCQDPRAYEGLGEVYKP